jgi:hypothetical protein
MTQPTNDNKVTMKVYSGIPNHIAFLSILESVKNDKDYALAWHMNIFKGIYAVITAKYDTLYTISLREHYEAHKLAAFTMQQLFEVDMWPMLNHKYVYTKDMYKEEANFATAQAVSGSVNTVYGNIGMPSHYGNAGWGISGNVTFTGNNSNSVP